MTKRFLTVIFVLLALCCTQLLGWSEAQATTEGFESGNLKSLPWLTGSTTGNSPWSVTTVSPNTGSYAAQSPASLADGNTSFLETKLVLATSGDMTFWYRVSSEEGWDWLIFSIDGVEKGRWSGNVDWAPVTILDVSAGSHTFRWEYSKDEGGGIGGDDTVWIDDIVFPGGVTVPTYAINVTVDGGNGSISCDSPSPVTHGSSVVCTISPVNGFHLATLTDNGTDMWSPGFGASYSISNVTGIHTIVGSFTNEASDIETFETRNLRKFPWSTWSDTGTENWSVTAGSGLAGSYAVQPPASMGDSNASYLETTLNIPAGGDITFWYKVSSEEGADFLKFYVDDMNTPVGSWSGTGITDWTQFSYHVNAGGHTFRWVYSKDTSTFKGQDTAWIDDIVFPGTIYKSTYTISASVIGGNGSISCPPTANHGTSADCNISPDAGYRLASLIDNSASKLGEVTANKYTINKISVDHTIVGRFISTRDLEDFETADFTKFPWTFGVGGGAATESKWSVTTASGISGSYAAESPVLAGDQSSFIETALNIPANGDITFWYKVSSEEGGDFLNFYIDDVVTPKGSWSGDTGWQLASFPVLAGPHTFRWEYSKDGGVNAPIDKAWIDEIVFPGANYKPVYTVKASVVGGVGGVVSCNSPVAHGTTDYVCAITPAVNYHFANLIDNSVNNTALVSNGSYAINPVMSDHTITVTFIANSYMEDFETGDLSKFPWSVAGTGNALWSVTAANSHTGLYAAQAPISLSDSGTSILQATLTVPDATAMTFWCSVSSFAIGGNSLTFFIDDIPQDDKCVINGQWAPDPASYPVSAGKHIFKWEYSRLVYDGSGNDTAWLDDIVIPGASSVDLPVKLVSGEKTSFKGTLNEAYGAAVSGDTILLKAGMPVVAFTAGKDIFVTIKGGHDDLFATSNDKTVLGKTSLQAGTVRMENIVVK